MFLSNYALASYGMDFAQEVLFLIKLSQCKNQGIWYLQNIERVKSANSKEETIKITWTKSKRNCIMFDSEGEATEIVEQYLSDRDVEYEKFIVGEMI